MTHGNTGKDKTRQGKGKEKRAQDKTTQHKTRQDNTTQHKTRQIKTNHRHKNIDTKIQTTREMKENAFITKTY
jgi:hypothetical protein